MAEDQIQDDAQVPAEETEETAKPRDDRNQGGFQRQMYDVDEKCSKCNAAITQLPFKPDPARRDQLQCRDCYRQKRSFNRDR